MTEQQAIEALHALPRLPRSGASLERMQALLDHLGNPEKQFKCIHIAGTNGKGTLAAMTSSILTHAGYKRALPSVRMSSIFGSVFRSMDR